MTDAPQIDDRRRFKELWKELLFARFLVGLAAGGVILLLHEAALGLVVRYYGSRIYPGSLRDVAAAVKVVVPCAIIAIFSPFAAAPSAVAKRGKRVLPLIALSVAVGQTIGTLASGWGSEAVPGALFGVVGAALGLAEGTLERSVAAIYSGLLGGALIGAILGMGHRAYLNSLAGTALGPRLLAACLLLAALHVGIGLSLALGRWIRDLPKRKSEQGQGDGGDAAAP